MSRASKLYVATLEEKDNANCHRDVYIAAPNMEAAATKAVRENPHNLYRPRVVAVKVLEPFVK